MNINRKLISFAQQELVLGRKQPERDKINRSLSHLETILKDKLGGEIKEFIRFGSYTRNTILPRKYDAKSDVDLMIVFNTNTRRMTPGTYRKWIQDVVSVAYPNSLSKKDFPVIKLELNHIMFDLVPAYSEQYFLGGKSFYIPGQGDSWQQTVPNDINNSLAQANQADGSNTVRNVIRLCKHWNAGAGYPLASYQMEKKIIDFNSWRAGDTYPRFLETIRHIGGNRPGVLQALEHIKKYKGDWWTVADVEKEWQWVQKLLPGLS